MCEYAIFFKPEPTTSNETLSRKPEHLDTSEEEVRNENENPASKGQDLPSLSHNSR